MAEEQSSFRLPSNLLFASDVLSGYSRNRFKLQTTSSDTATSGRIITVNLPENALLDMKSLRFFAHVDAGKDVSGSDVLQGILPEGAESLISKVECYINGVQVQSGAVEYNTACKIKKLGAYNQDNQQTKGKLVNHAAIPEIEGGSVFLDTDEGEKANICVDSWCGFLNELSTRFLPTDLLL